MKTVIQHIFGLRKDVGLKFYFFDFIFRKILGQNRDTKWAVHHTSTIIHPNKIIRGKNVYPGDSPSNYIQAINGIKIGDDTNLGPGVGLISANHNFIENKIHDVVSPIIIGKNCWIGMNAIVLPSVVLGDYTIVGAGSVVTNNFEEGYCVIGGNPAKKIKNITKESAIK